MPNKSSSDGDNTVRSVRRAMDLLQALISAKEPMSQKALSKRVNLHPSTTHRLLATLDKGGFVCQDPDNKHYDLGPVLMNLKNEGRSLPGMKSLFLPILTEIRNRLGESASLAVRSGDHAVLVAQVSSERHVNVTIKANSQVPLHCTAVGKVILAHLPHSEVVGIVDKYGLPPITPNTLTKLDQLEDSTERIRLEGYATDNEEWESGIRCIAVPVYYRNGSLLGAVSISGPAGRVSPDKDAFFASVIKECTAHLI